MSQGRQRIILTAMAALLAVIGSGCASFRARTDPMVYELSQPGDTCTGACPGVRAEFLLIKTEPWLLPFWLADLPVTTALDTVSLYGDLREFKKVKPYENPPDSPYR